MNPFVSPAQRKYVMGYVLKGLEFLSLSSATLKKGMEGKHVEAVQKFLKERRDYEGKIDGKFGPGTNRAVRKFQTAFHLTANGVVDMETKKAMGDSLDVNTEYDGDAVGVKPGQQAWTNKETAKSLEKLNDRWEQYQEEKEEDLEEEDSDVPNIRITDISKKWGGKFGKHECHDRGNSVDFGLINSAHPEQGTDVSSSDYDSDTTQSLVDMIAEDPRLKLVIVDPDSELTKPAGFKGTWQIDKTGGHNNHIHVTYKD